MTTRIAFLSESGSTHKTTTAAAQATLLAQRGQQVRARDTDGQGDLTQFLGWVDAPYVLADLLGRNAIVPNSDGDHRIPTLADLEVSVWQPEPELAGQGIHYPTAAEWLQRITLIPSGVSATGAMLGDVTTALATDASGTGITRLTRALTDEASHAPDVEIYDTHGTKSAISYRVMAVADAVITCVTPDDKAVGRHLDELAATIEGMREFNPKLHLAAIVPGRARPLRDGKFYTRVLDELRRDETYGHLVTPPIREAVVVPEAYEAREPVPLYVPRDKVTDDHRAVLEWLDEHGVTR